MNEPLLITPWQIIGIVCAILLAVLIVYLIGLIRELKKTARQLRETLYNANEIIEDIQATKMLVIGKIAELKKASDVVKRFKEIKAKREAKKLKKMKGED